MCIHYKKNWAIPVKLKRRIRRKVAELVLTDLHGVGVVGRVLEEPVVWVEHLSGEQEEELPGGSAVVQTLLPGEVDVQL